MLFFLLIFLYVEKAKAYLVSVFKKRYWGHNFDILSKLFLMLFEFLVFFFCVCVVFHKKKQF